MCTEHSIVGNVNTEFSCHHHFNSILFNRLGVGDRAFEPHSGLQVLKKENVSSPFTRKDSMFCGASVTARWRARPQTARALISNLVSGGQCHLIHLTVLRSFSWPSLTYIFA